MNIALLFPEPESEYEVTFLPLYGRCKQHGNHLPNEPKYFSCSSCEAEENRGNYTKYLEVHEFINDHFSTLATRPKPKSLEDMPADELPF